MAPLLQRRPVELFEPGMRLHLGVPIESQSTRRFPLQALVNEVGSFDIPALRYLILSDMRLFG